MSVVRYDYSISLAPDVVLQVRHLQQGGGGPTLVLLHEALGNIALWRDFPEQLSDETGLDVLLYERRGYGSSSPISLPREDNYLIQEGEYWLPQLLKELNLEQVVLVGHSDGGSIALIGAASAAEKVHAVVAMAAHIYVDDLTLAGIHQAIERYQNSNLPERLARYHGDRTEMLFRAWTETWLRESFQRSLDLRPWLPRIHCPALIIQGTDDHYGLPQQVTDIVSGIGSHARAEHIPDCGHSPHHEQPRYILDQIGAFLTGV